MSRASSGRPCGASLSLVAPHMLPCCRAQEKGTSGLRVRDERLHVIVSSFALSRALNKLIARQIERDGYNQLPRLID